VRKRLLSMILTIAILLSVSATIVSTQPTGGGSTPPVDPFRIELPFWGQNTTK